jgi:cytochrome oxidase assembly protein ShyY1
MPLTDIKLEEVDLSKYSKEEFEKKWLYRPVRIKGIFDYNQEFIIQRPK